jgi:hypothetical protein
MTVLTLAWAEDCCGRLLATGFSGLLPAPRSVAVALFLFVRLRGFGAGYVCFLPGNITIKIPTITIQVKMPFHFNPKIKNYLNRI